MPKLFLQFLIWTYFRWARRKAG